jgi:NADH-quinone oxidoreductase E subunit
MQKTSNTVQPDYTAILSRYDRKRSNLIPILQDIQEVEGFLPTDGIYQVDDYLELAESKIFGVATFYNQFKLIAPGKYKIQICRGTACHVRGSALLLEALQNELDIAPGETTKDGLFSLETVACIGACSIAPAITINGEFYGKLDKEKVLSLLNEFRNKESTNAN